MRIDQPTTDTTNITDTTNKRFVTDANLTVIGNTSGTNSGNNAVNSLYSGLVSNATHTGDATGATALTVTKINGTALSGLATGILKNTTTTGVPSIAVAGDFPTLNQNTSGYSSALKSATTTVDVSAATAPSSGQVLTATSSTAATWQTPSGGGTPKVTILAQSTTKSSVTGTTAETALATYTMPANTLPANGILRITSLWSRAGAAGTATARIRFGGISGTVHTSVVASANAAYTANGGVVIYADNSTSAQKSVGASLLTFPYTGNIAAMVTSAVDTTAAVDIVISGQLVNAADTLYLEGYTIEMLTP